MVVEIVVDGRLCTFNLQDMSWVYACRENDQVQLLLVFCWKNIKVENLMLDPKTYPTQGAEV